MSSEYKNVSLGELADIKHGWAFKSDFFSDLPKENPVVVGIGNFRYEGGFRFESTKLKHYKGEFPNEYLLDAGEILLVMTCQTAGGEILGIPGRIPSDNRRYLHNQRLGKFVNKRRDVFDNDYAYNLFKSADFNRFLASSATGTKILHTSPDRILQYSFELPPIHEQKAIAHILGTLDDKIELNRKTNETLEAMAKALFKSWFVDFDPVRAKAEGRPTGLPAEISDLFPDSFEDSELGEIPSGWRVGTIASSVGEVFDGPHATPKEADEGHVFLGIKNMTGSSLDLSDVKLIGHDDWSQWTRRVEPRADDIVFTYEAALGLFAVIPDGLKCCLGRRMALIRTKASNGAPHFWCHQFIAKPFQKVIEERSIHGATVNRTPLTEFPGYPILEPPETLRLAFDHAASSLWVRIHAASNQTASLTSLRDTLLPKLISGEIRIPDAEKLLEDVGV